MTSTTTISNRPKDHYRLTDVIRSEWTKFISLRSSRWVLAGFAVTGVALGIIISLATAAHWPHTSAHTRAAWDPTNNTLGGLAVGYLVLPMLGVLMMSSEYSYGSIGATLGAVPNRRLVLAAKAIVIGAVAFVVGEVVTFTTFLAGQSVMGTAPHASLGQPGVFRAVALSGAFQALLGVFGLGLGTIIRRSAAAITAYAGLVFVLPVLVHPLPGNVSRFGPVIILGNSVGAVKVPHDMLSPWAGFVVMALYAAVAVTVGGLLLVRRDA